MNKSNWHEKAATKWDYYADDWNASSEQMWESGSRKTIVPFFQKYVENGSAVLDVACGDGYGSLKLAKNGYNVTATDISEKMIDLAKKSDKESNVHFIRGDMIHMPFEDGQFDAVMVINGIEWTEHPLNALNELKRVVKEGGYLCAAILGPTAHPRKNSYDRLYGRQAIMNTMMPWEFMSLSEENGWKIIDHEGVMKRGVTEEMMKNLPLQLNQALSFMWVFMLQKM
ncbi:class I SAM-dependent methyltransferase [Bacillus sp. FJAT-47783]|uniref:class I SAM-dependent methyltransferase n=1 Tax=Bacillus sp. FJAT-47783 TaxID=2922712 RepID=UPI001FACDB1D|nr:class I SAM-dependent methyltransferase [Bacillus sp. FJAT-47783]